MNNSIITTADYSGKIKFFMRAASTDEPYYDELLDGQSALNEEGP